LVVGNWQLTDALVPVVMVAMFPFFEWVIHVFILHWRPRRLGRVTIDPLLARKHREHHVDPRNVALVFIPWKALLWVLPLAVAIALLALPRLDMGLTYLVFVAVLALGYEWTHYLIHCDYKPKSRVYRSIWRHHRLHHFKNEHYWFSVTSSGTADRVLRTYPDPATVPSSPTVKKLHARVR
jgi:sterol desaturase/sphingolipid hydroxylase (fatty acid hydroxylase superfamily)